MDSLKGQLLLASPALFDPNFRRAVVLVTEHNDEGAAGLVLNRPSETAVADAVPDLLPLVADDERVYVGGPVQESGGARARASSRIPTTRRCWSSATSASSRATATSTCWRRRPAGRGCSPATPAGGPGQLEAELEESSWIVEAAPEPDLFPEPEDDLWGACCATRAASTAWSR